MQPIKFTISDGKNSGNFTLDPLTQIRFMAYADVNGLNLTDMLERLIFFGTADQDEEKADFGVPDWNCLRNTISTIDDKLRWTREDEERLAELGKE
ncbi:MAG TPA: hypothetical protein VFA51_09545 [Candidatus Udaeobacter sp.]|nr:hypothetical protein [Candidatus Udaeobacter sp.]